MGKRILVSPLAASGRAADLKETVSLPLPSGLSPPSGLWSWFPSTISHSNHIFVPSKKSATACSRVWDHRCLLLFFSGPGNILPTCPCLLTWAGFLSGQAWVGGTVR